MAGTLGLDWELTTAMINKLRVFIAKVGSMQEQMGNASRDRNPKKTPKSNTRS